jgi:hypothetical protein
MLHPNFLLFKTRKYSFNTKWRIKTDRELKNYEKTKVKIEIIKNMTKKKIESLLSLIKKNIYKRKKKIWKIINWKINWKKNIKKKNS